MSKKDQKLKILVGLSGGVDSAVVAYLLKKEGHQVAAVFMKNFSSRDNVNKECPWKKDQAEAQKVADFLDINLETWDFEEQYRETVVKYLFDTYKKGLTPNPDILCNSEIKFKLFLCKALLAGYDKIATGHYAQIKEDKDGYHLLQGLDDNKDQTYFLAGLNQEQLAHSLFPIGKIKKPEVRQIAKKAGLPNAERKDSQGICFVGKVKLKDFLQQQIPAKTGNIIDINGKIIGQHEGVVYYTIGQRKGIDIGGGPALYVISKKLDTNELIVGPKESIELYTKKIKVTDWHWLAKEHEFPIKAHGKIRYRQEDQALEVNKLDNGLYEATFKEKQFASAAGQTLAIYLKDELIASAIIID
ncbi:tRNA 2-thiouridine(34) synthase MnmA [bacterium]|jgi:tRNA-uridine 2-sulfurtransferase|nr:tRNA 2-thiouridine(34) synthase MnmA [bacterium]MBT4649238.1 tRNA 2-thiouridine(34) synthase MnmA [bacterium]